MKKRETSLPTFDKICSFVCIVKSRDTRIKCFANFFSVIDFSDEKSSISVIHSLSLNCEALSSWGWFCLKSYTCCSFVLILFLKIIQNQFIILFKNFCENKFVKSFRLSPLNTKSINSMQKYPQMIESYAFILKIFVMIFSLPIHFLIPFEMRSCYCHLHKDIQWVPIYLYSLRFTTYAYPQCMVNYFMY